MKKIINLRTKELFQTGLLGIVWIGFGIVHFFELHNSISLILVEFAMLIASVCVFIPHFIKAEKEDEMSEINKRRAKSNMFDFLTIVSGISAIIISNIDKCVVDLKLIMPFLFGGILLMYYILFIIHEKVGD